MLEAIRQVLREEMTVDDRVVVLGEDVGPRGGVFQTTAGLFQEFGPRRVLDTPLAESGIVGAAIGMAVAGLRPVAEIQFADFIHPAINQIINEAAKLRYRSAGAWTCPMVVRVPYGAVHGGGLYHGQSVESLFCHVPGLSVYAPSTPNDAYHLLRHAMRGDDPVIFLEPKRLYASVRQTIDAQCPGTGVAVARFGQDVTVVAYGFMLHVVLQAAEQLAAEGLSIEVLDPRRLRPFDAEPLLVSVRKTGRLCIVHEDTATCGFGAELAALVAEHALFDLDAPIRRITGPEIPGVPFAPVLAEAALPDAAAIVRSLRDLCLY